MRGFSINIKVLQDEDIAIEISDINDHRTLKTFKLIGTHQVVKGNIKNIKCTCIRDIEKKLYFGVKKEVSLSFLDEFESLMIQMQDDVLEAKIEFDIYSPENYSTEAMVTLDVIESLFLLEESGSFEYDVEGEEIFININGMEPVKKSYDDAISALIDINNNPKLSNIFAKVGPPQDLSNKIHTDEDARKAAKTFSEGRESLENLLYFCLTNNIKTFASCAGHEENWDQYNDGYIAFNIDDEFTRNFIKYLNEKISNHPNNISISESYDSTLTEAIYCNYGNADDVFTEILEILEQYITKENSRDELSEDNKLNKEIDDLLAQKNSATNSKSGFVDTMEGNVKLSLVQKATQFVKSLVRKIIPNKNQGEIKE